MLKNIPYLIFFLVLSVNFPILRAQTILSESDIEARHHFYKSELENKQSYFQQRKSSLAQQSYDAVYYKLEFDIGIEPNSFSGLATEKFVSLIDSLNIIELDFDSHLTILSITGDVASHDLTDYTLILELNSIFNSGDTVEVTIEYEGIPRTEGEFAGFWYGIHREGPSAPSAPVVFTLSQPFGARSWWPCKDDPSDKPDSMDILITIPNDLYNGHKLYAVSNGTLISLTEHDNNTQTFHWHEQYPIATYLVSLAISNYQIYTEYYVTAENDSMPVIYYVYPERIDDAMDAYDSTVHMLQTYSEQFASYPFFDEKYGMAHYGRVVAMEHQTVTSMNSMSFWTIAHELAHQWFGNLVTCADFHHIWLNEGWATYLEAIYAEKLYGHDGYHTYMNAISYYKVGKSIYVEDPLVDPIFDTIVYDKGAWVLHMLRYIMGDDMFFMATKSYLEDPLVQYRSATTSDFQGIMEQYYETSLDWFFQQWIYGMGYPSYNYSWAYTQDGDHYVVTLTIEQVQDISGSEEIFTMPLDIVIGDISGYAQDTLRVWNDERIQTFQLLTDVEPAEINLDPKNWVLNKSSEVSSIRIKDELLPFKYGLEQNFPNPFNPSTIINYELRITNDVDLSIYNLLGQKVATLVSERQNAGHHQVEWDASGFASGVYYYMIKAGEFQNMKKMILLK